MAGSHWSTTQAPAATGSLPVAGVLAHAVCRIQPKAVRVSCGRYRVAVDLQIAGPVRGSLAFTPCGSLFPCLNLLL